MARYKMHNTFNDKKVSIGMHCAQALFECISDLVETVPFCSDVATDFSTLEQVSICGLGVGAARLLDATSFDSLDSSHCSRMGRSKADSTQTS
jgi:hypothetical protein